MNPGDQLWYSARTARGHKPPVPVIFVRWTAERAVVQVREKRGTRDLRVDPANLRRREPGDTWR